MRKFISILILVLTTGSVFSQDLLIIKKPEDPAPVVQLAERLESLLQDSMILVPFVKEGKYGYLNYQTSEVVLPPMADHLNLLNTRCFQGEVGTLALESTDYGFFWEGGESKQLKIQKYGLPQVVVEGPPYDQTGSPAANAQIIPTAQSKGFTYVREADGTLKLRSFSTIYQGQAGRVNLELVEIGKQVLAIGSKPDYNTYEALTGIIDSTGNALPGFDFNFNRIRPVRGIDSGTWFLVRKAHSEDPNFHFVDLKGHLLPEDRLPNLDYARNFVRTPASAPYYDLVSVVGYGINTGHIIDFNKLKTLDIVPEGYQPVRLESLMRLHPKISPITGMDRTIMFVLLKDTEGHPVYMDFDGKIFNPK